MFDSSDYICNYSNVFKRTYLVSELRDEYCKAKDEIVNKEIFLCGRVFSKRIMGKVSFFVIQDFSGEIQLFLSVKDLEQSYKNVISYIKLGDIVGVKGKVFKTKTKELSLRVNVISFLAKNLKLFPDKWKGLLEKELCYRYRYLDLMVNKKTKNLFKLRAKIIFELRKFFVKRDYLEVETPIMQCIPGGALAKPFITYHNYLNANLYLRVSPELYLKRLIVGGFEKVFELSKNFRNEGVSNRHNPEFTMIEFYQAYSTYKDLMILTEVMLRYLSNELFGRYFFYYQDVKIDFSKKFKRLSFKGAIIKYNKHMNRKDLENKTVLLNALKIKHVNISCDSSVCELQVKLFEYSVEKNLIQPTFIMFYPTEISPLAKTVSCDNSVTERFELYIAGREIANGFSELNDPVEQAERFKKQSKRRPGLSGNELYYDHDYINALRYGLPPTAGEGVGVDRLVMLFTNSFSIKDVLLFPLMKSKE